MQPVTFHFPPTDDAENNLETIEEIEFISKLDPGLDEVLLGDVLEGSVTMRKTILLTYYLPCNLCGGSLRYVLS